MHAHPSAFDVTRPADGDEAQSAQRPCTGLSRRRSDRRVQAGAARSVAAARLLATLAVGVPLLAPCGVSAAGAASVPATSAAPAAADAPRAVASPPEASVGAARRLLTHEDVWLMRRIGAPQVSPDGLWAVFGVTEPAYERKAQVQDLWLVPTDGSSPPRRLTNTRAAETGVAWSPDSRSIAFASRRDGEDADQVYVLDLARGGEALRISEATLGARSPRFSPDGTRLLYVADMWPGALDEAHNKRLDDERKARRFQARSYEGFPIRHWDKWLDERQPHLFVQAAAPGTPARSLLAGTSLVKQPGYAGRVEDDGIKLDATWTPDGRGVVFAASIDRNRAAFDFTSNPLWLVSAEGGEPRRITEGRDSWGEPRFGRDGRTLYAERTPHTGRPYNATRVAAIDWPAGGAPRNLTDGVDRAVTSWGVSNDGTVWFLAEEHGHEKLFVVAPGRAPRLAFEMDAGVYTGLSVATESDAPVLVARWESAVRPPEVVRIDPVRGHAPLSRFSAARAEQLAWEPVEHFWFQAKNGRRIHNLLVRPPGFDPERRYPLLVLMHGGPHTMWRDHFFTRWNYHFIAQPGYVVLLTNYTGSTGFGEGFARGIERDPLAGPAEEINQAADEAIRRYRYIDGKRQCAGGASYGGHLANWLQGTTTRYRCLVSHAGLVDLYSQWATSDSVYHREVNVGGPPWSGLPLWRRQSPSTYAERFRTPVLVTIGEQDFRVPLNNTLEYWTILQRRQVPSRLVVFPGENHWILNGENSRYFYDELHAWLAKHLQE